MAKSLIKASAWKSQGVDVEKLPGTVETGVRETSMGFLGNDDKTAELTTTIKAWQRRMENDLELVPYSITSFEDSDVEIRYYRNFPIGFLKMPSKSGRGSKKSNLPVAKK